ncbi:unnamed protein product [Tenebrio molitor]|nr:unnamed protein product [Tenebrio molitor]
MAEDNTYVLKGPSSSKTVPNTSVGKLIYDQLLTHCCEHEAMVDARTEQSISYKDLFSKTCSLAASLQKSGYDQNTIVTIFSENCVEYFIPVLSTLYIGATVAPVNSNSTKLELTHALNLSKSQIIFCSKQTSSTLMDLKKELGFIKKIIVIDNKENIVDMESMDFFINSCLPSNDPLYRFEVVDVDIDNHPAFVMSSSGTTGLPKGVMLTHRNVLVTFSDIYDIGLVPEKKETCKFMILPFFHVYGLFTTLTNVYYLRRIVFLKKFEENLFLRTIEKYRITILSLVPPIMILLTKSPLVDKYDLSSVKFINCGSSTLSRETEEILKTRLKVDFIRQAYGLTEVTMLGLGIPLGCEKKGSVGKVVSYMSSKIRDPKTGKSLGPNQSGELCFKGDAVMKGYYRNEEATRKAFTSDGWFLTGDLAYYDEEGFFFIVGRLKELIKYKGFQVPPQELETILLRNPKIKDVAVVGLPDEEAGELPLAFVVKNSDVDLTEDEVKDFLADKVSYHKQLRGGVRFIKEIPKSASGKILKRKLSELLNK